jgi:FMN phosphatase YigB (HAD superfamily)
MSSSLPKLTDHKALIFDVYGTLADWETGIYTALQPLLSRFPDSAKWSRKEAILAFTSVELDVQAQNPTMLYSDLLAKVHEVLEARLIAASGRSTNDPSLTTLEGNPDSTTTDASSSASASTSTTTTTTSVENPHTTFGNSIKHWPVFPDSSRALHDLAKHFKLVVLSNVDHTSFSYTHSYLSEGNGPSENPISLPTYARPSPNPHPEDLWLPTQTAGSKSPFSLILTTQDTHAYKPALDGFNIALEALRTDPTLLGSGPNILTTEELKSHVLIVAQSLTHDHVPARQLDIRSVWIDRQGAAMRPDVIGEAEKKWTWRFETLGEMAKAVQDETEH